MSIGSFGENFPYSNFHDLNMDWIVKIVKDFLDQYTQIQQIITDGEQALNDTVSDGMHDLDEKAEALQALLDQWYNTHSSDIANSLANALQELQTATTNAINTFATDADAKAELALESIPADYSTLSAEVLAYGKWTKWLMSEIIPYGETITFDYNYLPVYAEDALCNPDGDVSPVTPSPTVSKSKVLIIPSRGIKRITITASADQSLYAYPYVHVQDRLGTNILNLFTGSYMTEEGEDYVVTLNRNVFDYNTYILLNWIGTISSQPIYSNNEVTIEFFTQEEWTLANTSENNNLASYNIYTPALKIYSSGHYIDDNGVLQTFASSNVRMMDADIIDKITITLEAGHNAYPASGTPFAVLKDKQGNLMSVLNPTSAGTYSMNINHDNGAGATLYINEFDASTDIRQWQSTGYTDLFSAYNMIVKRHTGIDEASTFYGRNYLHKPFDFYGKYVEFVGDSLSEGVIASNPIEYTTETWVKLFCQTMGVATYNNRAKTGACFHKASNPSNKSVLEQIQDIDTSNPPDYLFIQAGINDWVFGTELSDLATDVSNICQYCADYLPTTKVIYITPINEAGWVGPPASANKYNVETYRTHITYTVIVNDMTNMNSVIQGSTFNFPTITGNEAYINFMFGDKLHPTVRGYKTAYLTGVITAVG